MPSWRAALAMLPRDFSTAATISLRSLSSRRSARLLPSSAAGAATGAGATRTGLIRRLRATAKVEVLRRERLTAREDHCAFDDVLELAHVAGPVVLAQLL